MPDQPIPSPKPPDDSAPLAHDKTPVGLSPIVKEFVDGRFRQRNSTQWQPKKRQPLWAAILVALSSSTVPVLMMQNPAWNVIAASVLLGVATGVGTFFGMKSAGSRK